jgi:hypothetical protein
MLKKTIPDVVVLHAKWTWVAEITVACSDGAGGNGKAGVVAEVSAEYEDKLPVAPSDLIR